LPASIFTEDLREKESAKVACGKAYVQALAVGESPAEFIQARNIDDLLARC
jgi:type III restriction enzyme